MFKPAKSFTRNGLIRTILFTSCLIFVFACGDTKKTNRNPTTRGDQATVYETPNDGRDTPSDYTESEVSEDAYVYADEGSSIESDEIAIDAGNDPNDITDWEPIFFAFDHSDLSDAGKQQLQRYSTRLLADTALVVLLEGHCDTRGTEDYNLGLGERRAQAVKRYLMQLGVSARQLQTISYGELRPAIPGENDAAWSQNRRVAFTF